MNTSRETDPSRLEDQINRTLHLIGAADPRPGLEKRITARLAHVPVQDPSRKSIRLMGIPRLAVASAAGLLAAVVIIAASVNHSRHLLPIAPGLQVPGDSSSGVGAASAEKVAPKPVIAPANGHARSVRQMGRETATEAQRKTGTGRATISPDAQKPDGVAVPKGPPPQVNPNP
jgi:hypothetical protein